MLFRITLILIVAFVAGCATVTEMYTPDGRVGLSLNCSGTARSWDMCYSAAGDACGESGYDILDRVDTFRVDPYGQTVPQRSMMIACKSNGATTGSNGESSEGAPAVKNTGTCFFVNSEGGVITNEHVVAGASSIEVELSSGVKASAVLVKRDRANDLALLHVPGEGHAFLPLAPIGSLSVGEEVFTMGYPATGILGTEPKYSDGVISSMTGYEDAANVIQMTVPLQPGNSGGPVVNRKGQVVAIATSTAAIEDFYGQTGALPQNVNWAIKADYAYLLAETATPNIATSFLDTPTLVARTEKALCRVFAKTY